MMDPLSVTASAIAVFQISGTIITACYNYRSRVKSSSKDAERIVNELNALRAVLDSLFTLLHNESEDASEIPSNLQKLAAPDGPLHRCQTSLGDLLRKLEPKEGWRAARATIFWPLTDSDIRRVLHDIDSTKATLQLALTADQRKSNTIIQQGIKALQEQGLETELRARLGAITEWLDAPNPALNHMKARKSHQVGTGKWFLESYQYNVQFFAKPKRFFWIHGIPGCGKTTLTSAIIDDVWKRIKAVTSDHKSAPEYGLAYFYFDFNNNKHTTRETLIRSIISQLLGQISKSSTIIDEFFGRSQTASFPPSADDFNKLLHDITSQFGTIYIIIDAVDESTEMQDVLDTLLSLYRSKQLNIVVTSRTTPEINQILSNTVTDKVCLDSSTISGDISLYITDQLEKDPMLSRWPVDVREMLGKTLAQDANGMFRWVFCQLNTLKGCLTKRDLLKQLSILPKSLYQTYERILQQISIHHRDQACRVLQWLAFSIRPITYQEAAEVLAIELGENPRFDPDGRLLDPLDVLSLCGNLVIRSSPTSDISLDYFSTHVVYEEYGDPPLTSSVIQLAHLSVKDYLVSHDLKKSDLCMFALDTIIANRIMAQSCLVYLLQSTIISENYTVTYSSAEKNLDVNWPLYNYAAHYCFAHIGLSDDTMDEQTWKLAQQLFDTQHHRNSGSYGFWLSALMGSDQGQLVAPKTSPLYYAASFGTVPLVKKMLETEHRHDINATGGRYNSSPLHVACYRGHIRVLELLLNAGADPNESNSEGESSLFWAICGSYHEIQKLLESHGARLTPLDKKKLEDFVE